MNKNDFAPTPPMGWNSYDTDNTMVNEACLKTKADYMAKHLKQYGWQYIILDTEWYNANPVQPDPIRFPSAADGAGFKPLADYIHQLGLKFGIRLCPSSVCFDSIMEQYASWGVDLIMYDGICDRDISVCRREIEALSKAVKQCGRPIALSLSPGPALLEEGWHYAKHTNMWHISDDSEDHFQALKKVFKRCELWQTHVKRGCYPDCGTLRTASLTYEEAKTMMTLWCLFGSPLMLDAELTEPDERTLSLLTNREILSMLSPDCIPHQLCLDEHQAIWQADNTKCGENYVALFNLSEERRTIEIPLRELGYYSSSARLTELWTGNLGCTQKGRIIATLAPHACAAYRVEF